MNLSEQDLKKIKALHAMLKMPVRVLERSTDKVLKEYISIYKQPVIYEFRRNEISAGEIEFYSGMMNELFLCFYYKEVKIMIGAFRINQVPRNSFSLVYENLSKENRKILSEEECWKYYSALPFYPLGDMRDYMILLDFLFGMNL